MDVDRIMERVRSRIEEKKHQGDYTPEESERIERMTLQIQSEDSDSREGDIQYRLSQINYLCDTAQTSGNSLPIVRSWGPWLPGSKR